MKKPKTVSLRLTAEEVAMVGAAVSMIELIGKSNKEAIPPVVIKIKAKTIKAMDTLKKDGAKKLDANEILEGGDMTKYIFIIPVFIFSILCFINATVRFYIIGFDGGLLSYIAGMVGLVAVLNVIGYRIEK